MMHDYGRVSVKTFYDSVYYCHKCTCTLEGAGKVVDRVNGTLKSEAERKQRKRDE